MALIYYYPVLWTHRAVHLIY